MRDVTKFSENTLIDQYTTMFTSLEKPGNLPKIIEEAKLRRDIIQKKKSKLLEYNVTGQISDTDFIAMNKQCAEEIAELWQLFEDMRDTVKQ